MGGREERQHNCYHAIIAVSPRTSQLRTFRKEDADTDDANQCLHNRCGRHWVPNSNLFNFTFLLVDFGKELCSSMNELQQNSYASSREEYIPQILTVLLWIPLVYI